VGKKSTRRKRTPATPAVNLRNSLRPPRFVSLIRTSCPALAFQVGAPCFQQGELHFSAAPSFASETGFSPGNSRRRNAPPFVLVAQAILPVPQSPTIANAPLSDPQNKAAPAFAPLQ
jgi:hypothetical protein